MTIHYSQHLDKLTNETKNNEIYDFETNGNIRQIAERKNFTHKNRMNKKLTNITGRLLKQTKKQDKRKAIVLYMTVWITLKSNAIVN